MLRYASVLFVLILAHPVTAQSVLQGIDITSPEMTEAELSRESVLALLDQGPAPIDLTGKRLSGLDLSDVDFKGAILRSVRLNNAKLKGSNLAGVVLDQAWLMGADLQGANLKGASLFQSQMMKANLDGADLSGARITANFERASLRHASFKEADLGADMRNQSMGLIRSRFNSATLDDADFRRANLNHVSFEFASMKRANLTRAQLRNASLAGADLSASNISFADFTHADVNSARLTNMVGVENANLNHAKNLTAAITQ